MFYKKGIDITKDKQMFNFLKEHYTYYTGNSWNQIKSIANNVKLYRLDLSGSWTRALDLLECGEYEEVNWMIQDWEREHSGYKVYFNGRSGGYLVLYNADDNKTVLIDEVEYNDDYEGYKEMCREYFGSVKAARYKLVEMVKLVQDFDKLCDQLRDYCDELSKLSFEVVEMQKSVDEFNTQYADDLDYLGFEELSCDEQGSVNVSEIIQLKSLYDAFCRTASRAKQGYLLSNKDNIISYKRDF
jgi:hypothetical protein